MPLSELVSSSCSNSAQSAYFRSPSSQSSGNFMGSLLAAPGALKSEKIWVRCARAREKTCRISVRFTRRRRQAPTSPPQDVQTEGKQRSKAGQHRLPGDSPVKIGVEM